MDGQGYLERTWKVREKSGTMKINGNGKQSSEKLVILFKRGKAVLPHETLKGKNLIPWGANSVL